MEKSLEKPQKNSKEGVYIMLGIITALYSFYVYKNQFHGAELALLIMFGIFFHEIGHYLTAKYTKEETRGIYFVPYIGAVTLFNSKTKIRNNALISVMDPVFGVIISAIYLFLYAISKNHVLLSAGIISLLVNLSNLIPVPPLDGGHVFFAIIKSLDNKALKWFLFITTTLFALLVSSVAGYLFIIVLIAALSSISDLIKPVKSELLNRKDMLLSVIVYWTIALASIWLMILVLHSLTLRELLSFLGIHF